MQERLQHPLSGARTRPRERAGGSFRESSQSVPAAGSGTPHARLVLDIDEERISKKRAKLLLGAPRALHEARGSATLSQFMVTDDAMRW